MKQLARSIQIFAGLVLCLAGGCNQAPTTAGLTMPGVPGAMPPGSTSATAYPEAASVADLQAAAERQRRPKPWGRVGAIFASRASQPQPGGLADSISLTSQAPTVGADLHYHAAGVYESQNNVPAALRHYGQALALAPNDPTIQIGVARLYQRCGDSQHAEQFYRAALTSAPENTVAMNDLALSYARQNRLDEAVHLLRRAVELQPAESRYRNNLAALLVQQNRLQEAFPFLEAVHGVAGAHYNLGYLLSENGQVPQAVQQLNLAIQADPKFQPARDLLTHLSAAPQAYANPAVTTFMPEGALPQARLPAPAAR